MEPTPRISVEIDEKTNAGVIQTITRPFSNLGWRLAVYFNMDAVVEAQWSEQVADMGRPDIQHLRR